MTTGTARVHSVKCFVVFGRADGQIHHVHHSVTMVGGAETPDQDLGRRVLSLAAKRGVDPATVDVLQIEPAAIQPGERFFVDTKNRALVRIEK
ncbi:MULTISPECIES: hypothetical protein [unclassified Mycobacterium]|uniref:hypothetical protein n=1 Tax=unclassified Mycobacterium TaxID=2642494 RepID=UPI001115A79D|nr:MULTISPECIES: hypothetical protein [unclassified Mycobacterium]